MNHGATKLITVVGVAATMGGCATHHPAPPVTGMTGYTFGYHVVQKAKGQHINANVVSGKHKTWFSLPAGVKLLQANGDGKPAHLKRDGAYWIAPRVSTIWKLYTNDGPVEAVAPPSVGVVLAAQKQAKASRPHYVWKTEQVTVGFKHGAQLDSAARHKLAKLDKTLTGAHKIDWVKVSGQTTPSGDVPANAKVGAERSSVVSGWLNAHGVSKIRNIGWTPGSASKSALIAAHIQVRLKPPHKVKSHVNHSKPMPKTDVHKQKAHCKHGHMAPSPHKGEINMGQAQPVHKKAANKAQSQAKAAHKHHSQPAKPVTHKTASKPVKKQSKPETINPKKAKHYLFKTHKGDLLSTDLNTFLRNNGWSLVWRDSSDYSLQYAARFEGKTIKATLKQVVRRFGVRIILYRNNHVAVVESTNQGGANNG